MIDAYAAAASAYDLCSTPRLAAQRDALEHLLPRLDPDVGPILDIGAGSGAITALLLERLPRARVLAIEPSAAMRALLLGRIASRPEWFPRVTVRPEPFLDAPLPERIGGAIALGVLGHFDPGERAAVLAELAARLPAGAGVLLDLQHPEQPEPVAPYEFTAATVGDISYRCIVEAEPVEAEAADGEQGGAEPGGGEAMRWRTTYLALEGDLVLTESTAEHLFHHPAPERFAREAGEAGFAARRLDEHPEFWVLERR